MKWKQFNFGDLVDAIPKNDLMMRFCRRYANHYNADNNCDMFKNGEMRWLKDKALNCRVVFDVGANVGDWTACALQINPSLEVHLFEPSPQTFGLLERREFQGANVHMNCLGLSDFRREATMYVFENGGTLNSMYNRHGLDFSQREELKIAVDTLDNYCGRQSVEEIDILKIDVEGHELSVLKGAGRMLAEHKIRFVQFEYGGTYIDARILLKDMFELLCSYQYQLYKILPKGLQLHSCYKQSLENFQYSNWVAVL